MGSVRGAVPTEREYDTLMSVRAPNPFILNNLCQPDTHTRRGKADSMPTANLFNAVRSLAHGFGSSRNGVGGLENANNSPLNYGVSELPCSWIKNIVSGAASSKAAALFL